MTSSVAPTPFINIQVSVKPGLKPGQYIVNCDPAAPAITQPDTVINYQLVDTDGLNIVFKTFTVKQENNQLSPPSVSTDGLLMTFNDINTEKMTLNINLKFKDKDGVEFSHDPQIENEPQ
ncbi:hypothetical protein [Rugamonas rivuli]|uniref:Uncharacterized protein n=1 Tax=Rugamonas rivuli TaxID=2743358 RepID=A0A843SM78_9BURK|nr:hypothetical protein [Rugamonas rivuli]MQA23578.1 hypothetical protein [Rugamonas rivuli]